jgi:hypothetical protein
MAMPYLGINEQERKPLITISPRVTDKQGQEHDVPADHPADAFVGVQKKQISIACRNMFPEPFTIYCLDSEYYAPQTLSDAKYFVGRAHVNGKYVKEIFDCDDFARAFKELMVEQGFTAVGRVVDFKGGHSYNAIVIGGDDRIRMFLVEPQTGHIFPFPDTRHKPYMGNGHGYIEW